MIAAVLLLAGGIGGLVGCWQYGEYVKRRDYRDRARTGRLWAWFDADAWASRGWRLAGVAMLVVGVGGAVVASPGLTATLAVAGVAVWALRRRFRGDAGPLRYDPVIQPDGRQEIVYALGSFHHITGELRDVKFGITVRGEATRCAEVDDREQTGKVEVLATGPGGHAREQAIFDRVDEYRYPRSEWFAVAPEVLDEVRMLENPTKLGMQVLRKAAL